MTDIVDSLIEEAKNKIDYERADRILQFNRYQDRVIAFMELISQALDRLDVQVVDARMKKRRHFLFWKKRVKVQSSVKVYAKQLSSNVAHANSVAEYKIPINADYCLIVSFNANYEAEILKVTYESGSAATVQRKCNAATDAIKTILPYVLRSAVEECQQQS